METKGKDIIIKVNGINICYDDLGEGLVPIIFIHGFPFDKSTWQPQLELLQSTNRVIAYDIRGFGKSTSDHEALSIGLFADDLVQLMDALQIKQAIVCGLSMGGYILLNALNRYADRFAAVILSDTQCIADSSESKAKRYKLAEQIEKEGLDDFATSFSKTVLSAESLNNNSGLAEHLKKIILSTSKKTVTGTLTALTQRHEMCSWLRKIQVPVLIVCGKEDTITPFVQSEFMHNKILNSSLYKIDKAGHLSNLEQPEAFNDHICNFILNKANLFEEQFIL